ncbi:hypothetical protein SISSUDRAFT_1063918 [Sistotremastrum suecicum HHB10207 ss-3]|uniref:C2H2-type domain-containing protein n=1 Tax=Sistotremastrum suecicum HHB10207 ss-3 TaxID=1314776 RepID=A0A166B9B9_9AGAM|nr:hypothetical protein SISSUDRAFT_1063918 [Sistotremastrum suecicum HHB10207 ss-3]
MRTRSNLIDKANNKATTPRTRAKKFSTDPKKGHKCDICHRILGRKSDLDRHMDTHSDLPPRYPCELGCGMRFWQKAARATHHDTQQHNDRRDHVCPECSRAFSEKGAMKRHLTEIHGEGKHRSYDCHCGKSYKRRSSWRTHFAKVHQGEHESTPEPTYSGPKSQATIQISFDTNQMDQDGGYDEHNVGVRADVSEPRFGTDVTASGDSSPVHTPSPSDQNQETEISALASALRNSFPFQQTSAFVEVLQYECHSKVISSARSATESGLHTLAGAAASKHLVADDKEMDDDVASIVLTTVTAGKATSDARHGGITSTRLIGGEQSSTPEPTYRDPKPSAAKHNYTSSDRMVQDEGHGDAITEVKADVYKTWSETDATTTGDSSPVYTPVAAGPNQNLNTNELTAALRNMLIEEPHSASLETLQQNGQPRIASSINIASKSGLETIADVATVREVGAEDEEMQIDEMSFAVRRGRETFAFSFVLN